jgi:predicted RNA-binding Zn ribbon-like protein
MVETGGAMQDIDDPRELPVVAGHLALDFANTVDDPEGPQRHDHLATYDGLVAWSVRVGVLGAREARALRDAADASPRSAAAALRRAHALRDAANDVFGAIAGGRRVRGDAWAVLRAFAVEALAEADLGRAHELRWDIDGLRSPLHPVATAAVDLLRSEQVRKVKQCAGCPWLFLDGSRNGSRRWCSMEDCGTHQKVTRYVARRAERRASERSLG